MTGSGPDNFWHVRTNDYWIIECKNKKSVKADIISKKDTGQLSNSIGWFQENYEDSSGVPIIIHRANVLAKNAFVNEPFWVIQPNTLGNLKRFCRLLKTSELDA